MNNILFIFHSTFYNATYQVMRKLKANPIIGQYASLWSTVYLGLSPITNRTSKEYRDYFWATSWYDQVVTFGLYHSATFNLPELEATL